MPEKQKTFIFKENRQIIRGALLLGTNYVVDEKSKNAWFRFREYLQLTTDCFKRGFILPVDERTVLPINPYKPLDDNEIKELANVDETAASALDMSNTISEAEQRKTRFYDFMGIAIMGVVIVFMISVILYLSGSIDFSKMGGIFGGGG